MMPSMIRALQQGKDLENDFLARSFKERANMSKNKYLHETIQSNSKGKWNGSNNNRICYFYLRGTKDFGSSIRSK